jgi:hypothetical protein
MVKAFRENTQESYSVYLSKEFASGLEPEPPALTVCAEIFKVITRLEDLTICNVSPGTWCAGCIIVLKALQQKCEQGMAF